MDKNRVYLNSCILQKDMRVRMPKAILENMNLVEGESNLDVYFDPSEEEIIIKKSKGVGNIERV